MRIELILNGRDAAWDIDPGETLLTALRNARCFSVKRGCETGDCGACTVLLGDQPVNSCVVAAARAQGQKITTLEGLLDDDLMQQLQTAMVEAAAVQCGYCSPGLMISLYALFKNQGPVDEDGIRHALTGNLCRCTGYVKPVEAALAVAAAMEGRV